jgi:hypothetical protein
MLPSGGLQLESAAKEEPSWRFGVVVGFNYRLHDDSPEWGMGRMFSRKLRDMLMVS